MERDRGPLFGGKAWEEYKEAREKLLTAILAELGIAWTTWELSVVFMYHGIPTRTMRDVGYVIRSCSRPRWYENLRP